MKYSQIYKICHKHKKLTYYQKSIENKCGILYITNDMHDEIYNYIQSLPTNDRPSMYVYLCQLFKMRSYDIIKQYKDSIENSKAILMYYKHDHIYNIRFANYSIDENIAVFTNVPNAVPATYWS